jgi:hypothetical protein
MPMLYFKNTALVKKIFMKQISLILFITLFCHSSNCQPYSYKGYLIDSVTKKPIAYSTIITSKIAVYADSLGYFELNNCYDSIATISCIGYQNRTIFLNDYLSTKTYSLIPKSFELKEIILEKPNWLANKQIIVENIQTTTSNFSQSVPIGLTILKKFINPDSNKKTMLGSTKVMISKNATLIPKILRLRVFESNKDGTLGNDILPHALPINILPNESGFLEIDLNNLFLEMPFYGCYLGFENIGLKNTNAEFGGSFAIKGNITKEASRDWILTKYFSETFKIQQFTKEKQILLLWELKLYEK